MGPLRPARIDRRDRRPPSVSRLRHATVGVPILVDPLRSAIVFDAAARKRRSNDWAWGLPLVDLDRAVLVALGLVESATGYAPIADRSTHPAILIVLALQMIVSGCC